MNDLVDLPVFDGEGNLNIVVETPRGASLKLKYERRLRAFVFDRSLLLGVTYPYDFGFIPSTYAEDGDPLDAMVLFDAPTWPGVIVPSIPIGVVRLVQRRSRGSRRERNDRIIAVPAGDRRRQSVRDLPRRLRQEPA